MKFLLLLGFVTFALAENSELDCSMKGPDFWCKSEVTAKRCHAVDYCRKNVWLKEKVVSMDGEYCDYCQQFVGTIHQMLKTPATQKEVIDGMKEACNLLSEPTKSMCVEMVGTYGQIIINEILNYTKVPKELCTMLQLCTAGSKQTVLNNFAMMEKMIAARVSADYCMPCKEYITGLHSIVSSKRMKSNLIVTMKKMCQFLPVGISSLCPAIVDAMGEGIVDSILHYTSDPSRFCSAVGLCKGRDQYPLIMQIPEVKSGISDYIKFDPEKSPDADMCVYCQQIIGTIHMLLMNNASQEQLIVELKYICNFMPATAKLICDSVVELYGRQIVAKILSETKDPRVLCRMFHLCSVDSKQSVFNSLLMKKVIVHKVFGDYCKPCKEYIAGIHSIISTKKAKAELIETMKKMCRILPVAISTLCPAVVESMGEKVIDSVVAYTSDPSRCCAAVGFCKKVTVQIVPIGPEKELKLCTSAKAVGQFLVNSLKVSCSICEFAAKMVYSSLADKPTQGRIKGALLGLCNEIPSKEIKEECVSVINKDYDEFLNIILNELKDPKSLCKLLNCSPTSKELSTLQMSPMSTKASPFCGVCQYGAQYLSTYLSKEGAEAEIKSCILKECAMLPSPAGTECTEMVKTYFDLAYSKILIMLKKPLAFCQEMHMCPPSMKVSDELNSLRPNNVVTCEVCELLLQKVDTMLNGSRVKEVVKDALDKLCNDLPYAAQCTDLVNKYSAKIIDILVVQLKHPEQVCTLLQLCTSKVKVSAKLDLVKPNNVITCEVCELLLQKVDTMLNGSRVKEVVKAALDKLCNDLPYASQCTDLVNKYSAKIIDILVVQLKHPEQVCTLLQLCTSKVKVSAKLDSVKPNNVITCEICEFLLQKVDTMLNGSRVKEDVKAALDKLCNDLPYYSSQCTDLVNKYSAKIIDILVVQLKHPEQVCTLLQLCTPKVKALHGVARISAINGFVQCELCTLAMDYLLEKVARERTAIPIEKAIGTLCDGLPHGNEQCKRLVNKYTEEIIGMIIGGIGDGHTICKELSICDWASVGIIGQGNQMEIAGVDAPTCGLCMYLTGKLDVQLKKSDSTQVIKKTIKSVCSRSKLSKDHKEECQRMTSEFKHTIIQSVKEVNLPSFCKKIGRCLPIHSMINAVVPKFVQVLRKTNNGGTSCLVCEYAIGVLDTFLSKKSTKAAIIGEVQTVCKKLPRPIFINECEALIVQYGDDIVEMFVENVLAPVDICTEFHLC